MIVDMSTLCVLHLPESTLAFMLFCTTLVEGDHLISTLVAGISNVLGGTARSVPLVCPFRVLFIVVIVFEVLFDVLWFPIR